VKNRLVCAFLAVFAPTVAGADALADVPACPAWLGGYVATVDGGSVVICPTTNPPPPGYQATGCPFTTGMVRVDVKTGVSRSFLGPCVADPAANGAGAAGTPCFLDPCVPPGTYQYGYQIPAFTGCDQSCAGPTSGEWATEVTVSSSPSCVDDAGVTGPLGLSLAIWRDVDAAAVDGAVVWSGTCTGPLPGPDGGYCAWRWLDGSAQWAPCPPDGGTLCEGQTADGTEVPVECPTPGTGGSFGAATSGNNGVVNGTGSDAGGTVEAPAPAAQGGSSQGGGGCSVLAGDGDTAYAYAVFASVSLAITLRWGRSRRRRARATVRVG
jgi:hypothetical protein